MLFTQKELEYIEQALKFKVVDFNALLGKLSNKEDQLVLVVQDWKPDSLEESVYGPFNSETEAEQWFDEKFGNTMTSFEIHAIKEPT